MRARTVCFWLVVLAVLLPAVLLTCTRAVEPHGGAWIQIEAFTPLGLGLYAVVALLVGIALVLRRGRGRWLVVTAVLAGAGFLVHAWWYAPQLTGANPPPGPGAEPRTVMTANLLHGQADVVGLVALASDREVDLLVVEELTAAALADMERAGLDDLFPYRVGDPGTDADGTMAFAGDPLTAEEPLPTAQAGWSFRWDGLTVLAVHLVSPTSPDGWYADQATLAAQVDRLDPDLVVGDLNATVDHAPVRDLADAGYRDVGELANQGWQPTWPTSGIFDRVGTPLAQIDHVLVGPRVAGLAMDTAEVSGSDHRAVLAEVAEK